MMATLGCYLWQVSDREYLSVLESHFFHDICHLFSYLTAYAGINLIKDDGWQLNGSLIIAFSESITRAISPPEAT